MWRLAFSRVAMESILVTKPSFLKVKNHIPRDYILEHLCLKWEIGLSGVFKGSFVPLAIDEIFGCFIRVGEPKFSLGKVSYQG